MIRPPPEPPRKYQCDKVYDCMEYRKRASPPLCGCGRCHCVLEKAKKKKKESEVDSVNASWDAGTDTPKRLRFDFFFIAVLVSTWCVRSNVLKEELHFESFGQKI